MASTLTQSEEAQLAQTIEMFEVIIESQPHDYQSLEILKEAYNKLGREQDVVRTAKRIAEAYVDMGQLSSAILEYETILQRCPDDPDVQKALNQIESKANNLSESSTNFVAEPEPAKPAAPAKSAKAAEKNGATHVEDGRPTLRKIFVDSKIITAADFDSCWNALGATPNAKGVFDPFVQILADKGVLSIEKSLKAISDKSRVAFIPLEKYDIDIDLARTFPAQVCKRWCVLPFDRMSKSVLVATANPFNQQAAKEIAAATQFRLLWYLAPPAELIKNLQKAFR
jgi:tetratricopeptide (TPR) repeat protein